MKHYNYNSVFLKIIISKSQANNLKFKLIKMKHYFNLINSNFLIESLLLNFFLKEKNITKNDSNSLHLWDVEQINWLYLRNERDSFLNFLYF